jgi:starch synthase
MKEIIIDGETGLHVPLEQHKESPFEAISPESFASDLASAINTLLRDPDRCEKMGKVGRHRVQEHFSWTAIARETVDLYHRIAKNPA